jgi:hypothetical protein
MRTLIAGLVAFAVLALAAPAGASPIDAYGPIPSGSPAGPPPASSTGTETWLVVALSVLAFVLGAAAARLAPVMRMRMGES